MSQVEVDKIIPQSGTTLTLGESGDTITVPSGATLDTSNSTVTLPDGSVTSAKLSYPLTTFSSTGIDDNGTATAITIDSSQNVDIAGTLSIDDTLSISDGTTSGFLQTSGNLLQFGTSTNDPLVIYTNNSEAMRIDSSGNLQFNSGYGSVATAYGVRAWVNFNGTGTVAINGSGNVTSITDNGTGDYTVNFTTAMPSSSYSCNINSTYDISNSSINNAQVSQIALTKSTSAVRLKTSDANGQVSIDAEDISVSIII